MATESTARGQATFAMEQFRVAAPGLLEVEGGWDGVGGVDLDQPVLVLHVEDHIQQVEVESVRGTARRWHATFAWDGDPMAIRQAVLHVDGRLRVELGAPSLRRRLGRTARPALELLALPMTPEARDPDVLETNAALLEAQDRLAAAEDEASDAREEARRAVAEAERVRAERRRESERLHEALDALKRAAHEAVEAERERLHEQAAELETLRGEAAEREAELERLRADVEEARRAERDTAEAAAQLRGRLESVRRALDSA